VHEHDMFVHTRHTLQHTLQLQHTQQHVRARVHVCTWGITKYRSYTWCIKMTLSVCAQHTATHTITHTVHGRVCVRVYICSIVTSPRKINTCVNLLIYVSPIIGVVHGAGTACAVFQVGEALTVFHEIVCTCLCACASEYVCMYIQAQTHTWIGVRVTLVRCCMMCV